MQRRLLAGLLALTMLTALPFAPGTTVAADGAEKFDDFLSKALAGDPAWTQWADPQGRFEVLLLGPDHVDPGVMPSSRDAWNAHWRAGAQPFVDAVRGALRPGDAWMSEMSAIPQVKVKASPERIRALAMVPEIRGLALDWPGAVQLLDEALPLPEGPGLAMGQSVGMTGAFGIHDLGFLGHGVKLAVIDTGIRQTHEMLLKPDGSTRVVGWHDATGPSGQCANPCDTHGHGTHVATTAAGSNVAGGRHQGVAPRAELIGVRIFQGGGGTWEDAQEGLQASFDLGADLTTNSWGGGCGGATGGGTATEKLAENLAKAGLQHVFAAGNSGANSQGELCPGRNDLVISVGATDKNKVVASFSSGGLCPDATGAKTRICPDVSAVGVNVEAGHNPCDSCYTSMSGTSMATPHVAGGAVLVQQLNQALHGKSYDVPSQELEKFFEAKAQDLGAPGNDQRYGWGFIRLGEMLADLQVGEQARATVDLSLARAEMRNKDTNTATVMLNNVGGKAVNGTLRVTSGGVLEHDGHTYLTQAVSLDPGEGATITASIPGSDLDPTTYHVLATFEYGYTSDSGATVGTTVEDTKTFLLRGVKMGVTRVGSSGGWGSGKMWAGNETSLQLQLRNVGNEPATQVLLREGIPAPGFAISLQPTTSSPPLGSFSRPPPDSIAVNPDSKTFDMTYAPASIAPGPAYVVSYRVRAVAPGMHDFTAVVDFEDAIGDPYTQTLTQTMKVTCPGARLGSGLPNVPEAC